LGSAVQQQNCLRFGEFELDLETGEMRRGGVPIHLQPQPAKLLHLLASHPGQLVTREELRQQLWGSDTFVDFDQGLNFCVKQIRVALGDDAEKPRYIETMPRRGYRFIARVAQPGTAAPRSRRLWALAVVVLLIAVVGAYMSWRRWLLQPQRPGRILLAVLPFENLSGDPLQTYFSDGLTEELITELARLQPSRLGVIARTSTMHYHGPNSPVSQIGRELGVSYVVEGSVRRAGERVRISVQLIRVDDQTHLWAESYERRLGDVLVIQAEAARNIADQIQLRLTPTAERRLAQTRSVHPQALEAYLRGRQSWQRFDQAGVEQAIREFRIALENDPAFAPAYAGLADAYYALSNLRVKPQEAMEQARAAALKAVELDSEMADAHTSLALVKGFYDWDWQGAEQEFRRALDLNPGSAETRTWYGVLLAFLGREEESLAQLQNARELDPLSPMVNNTVGLPLYLSGRYEQALEASRRALQLAPDFYLAYSGLGTTYEEMGQWQEAQAAFERARALDDAPVLLAFLGRIYALKGDRERAQRALEELRRLQRERFVSPYDLAIVYEAVGEKTSALDCLEQAYEQRAEGTMALKVDPRFKRLRGELRYQALLRKMRFEQ
jgi:TolB-like protein/DNA-binding winged helix-turn-helix (wHTH) protein/Flp pilus assembly protein TadD